MNKEELQRQRDIEVFLRMQASPIYFAKIAWSLDPQPIKEEYKGLINSILNAPFPEFKKRVEAWEIKVHMFEKFEKWKHITWQQWLVLFGIEKWAERISVKSWHWVWKSADMAIILLWFLYCHRDCQAWCTAPTESQMKDVLWKEASLWIDRMVEGMKEEYLWSDGYIRMKENPNGWFARAKTARKENPEALAGLHAPFVLILVDEWSWVPDVIYSKMEGAMTGWKVLVVIISNPTRLLWYFYDTHNKDRADWLCLTFSCIDSPIVEKGFVERIIKKYWIESDEYRFMVLWLFPKADSVDDKWYMPLFRESDVNCIGLNGKDMRDIFMSWKKLWIDPSGEGVDETKWVARDQFVAMEVLTEKVSDPKGIATKVDTLLEHLVCLPEWAWVDNFWEGANTWVELAKRQRYVNCVNWKEEAFDEEHFHNKRAECYWRAMQWLRSGGQLVGEYEEWREDLMMIRYCRNERGKIQIMSKKDMKKLFGKSPDKADAFALTFYESDELMSYESSRTITPNMSNQV